MIIEIIEQTNFLEEHYIEITGIFIAIYATIVAIMYPKLLEIRAMLLDKCNSLICDSFYAEYMCIKIFNFKLFDINNYLNIFISLLICTSISLFVFEYRLLYINGILLIISLIYNVWTSNVIEKYLLNRVRVIDDNYNSNDFKYEKYNVEVYRKIIDFYSSEIINLINKNYIKFREINLYIKSIFKFYDSFF